MHQIDRTELSRLILQIERDLNARASLRTLLVAADTSIERHRRDLRIVKARLKRGSMKVPTLRGPSTPGRIR